MAATTTSKVLSVIRRGSCRSPLTASRILFTGNKHFQGGGRTPYLVCICGTYCTRIINRNDASLRYRDGLPVFSVPLPSRQETCEFVLKPISHTVGDFFNFMKEEDHGIDNISIYTKGSNVDGEFKESVLYFCTFFFKTTLISVTKLLSLKIDLHQAKQIKRKNHFHYQWEFYRFIESTSLEELLRTKLLAPLACT
eukprot:XP_014773307.1 PREDICTED: uncharacterized protein LOC106871399 [Octopus bimaculoides]